MYMTIAINYIKHQLKYVTRMYTVFYMYLHEYRGAVFTALC